MIRVNHKRANAVFSRLLDAYLQKRYPFNQPKAVPPQAPQFLPKSLERGTREHALFLFTLCYWMRGGIESDSATTSLAKLYDANLDLFLPESATNIVPTELAALFRSLGLGYMAEGNAGGWIKNSATIQRDWNGDPRNIFTDVTTYEEACQRVQHKGKRGFYGFQEKMVSMLIYFFMDAGFIDRWNFPIPVDIHVLRTVFAHKIMTATKSEANGNGFYTKRILAAARNLFMSYCVHNSVDPLLLCEAMWLHSRLMCKQHAGNQSKIIGERHGRKTIIQPVDRWTTAQTRAYKRTCAVCTVRETCSWCVPSVEYYVGGRIVLRGERDVPPRLLHISMPEESTRNRIAPSAEHDAATQLPLFPVEPIET